MIGVRHLFMRCARGLLAGSKFLFGIRELFVSAFLLPRSNRGLSSGCPCSLMLRFCGLIEKCWIAHKLRPLLLCRSAGWRSLPGRRACLAGCPCKAHRVLAAAHAPRALVFLHGGSRVVKQVCPSGPRRCKGSSVVS